MYVDVLRVRMCMYIDYMHITPFHVNCFNFKDFSFATSARTRFTIAIFFNSMSSSVLDHYYVISSSIIIN